MLRNNPAVSLATRRWLRRELSGEIFLDGASLMEIERALGVCAAVHPGGMIHDTARRLGGDERSAREAGSIAELFYCVCSLTDDIQDGEWGALGTDRLDLALNVQAQMLCLVAERARAAERWEAGARGIVADLLYSTGVSMLSGQRVELERSAWSRGAYRQVARLSAGLQFAAYFEIAARSAGRVTDVRPWRAFGESFGALLQLVVDIETDDDRLAVFDREALVAEAEAGRGAVERAARGLGEPAAPLVRGAAARCDAAIGAPR